MGLYNVLDRALLQNGQSEDISKVLENFDAIATVLNAGIDDLNFGGGLIFDPAKIKQSGATAGQALVWNGATWAPNSLVVAPTLLGPTNAGEATGTLVANTAYLMPLAGVVVATPITRLVFCITGGGATGNMDVGVYYTDDEVTFTKLASTGSFAVPATGDQLSVVVSTTITPVTGRRWYLAMACSSATPSFSRGAHPKRGSYSKVTSFPLPATLTGMTSPSAFEIFMYATLV